MDNPKLVFAGVDFFQVWFALMLGRYDWLARWSVALGETRPTQPELIAVMRSRTRRIETPQRG